VDEKTVPEVKELLKDRFFTEEHSIAART